MLHVRPLRQHDPAMAAALIDRVARRPEVGIGEGADGDGDQIGRRLELPVNGGAAPRTEMERERAAAVARPRPDGGLPLDPHLRPREPRLGTEHAAGAALARQAMADGDAHGIAVAGDAKLAATAGGVMGGHGTLPFSKSCQHCIPAHTSPVTYVAIDWPSRYRNSIRSNRRPRFPVDPIRHGFVTAAMRLQSHHMSLEAGQRRIALGEATRNRLFQATFLIGHSILRSRTKIWSSRDDEKIDCK